MGKRFWIVALAPLMAASAAAQDAPNPSFYLVNHARIAITRVFATPDGNTGWGENRLTYVIVPGANAPVRLPADGNCRYDVRVVYANGRSEDRRGLNTCELDRLDIAQDRPAAAQTRQDPSFLLINRSRSPVRELYISVSDDAAWGAERLVSALPGGGTRVIPLPTGDCVYDLRVVFANGQANERRRLNLCQLSRLPVP